jgi:hypothetical protein
MIANIKSCLCSSIGWLILKNDNCPTGADPADLIFGLQEKIGACPITLFYKPVMEEYVKGLEGKTDFRQVIPGDPDKPVLSLDSFQFEQFLGGHI